MHKNKLLFVIFAISLFMATIFPLGLLMYGVMWERQVMANYRPFADPPEPLPLFPFTPSNAMVFTVLFCIPAVVSFLLLDKDAKWSD